MLEDDYYTDANSQLVGPLTLDKVRRIGADKKKRRDKKLWEGGKENQTPGPIDCSQSWPFARSRATLLIALIYLFAPIVRPTVSSADGGVPGIVIYTSSDHGRDEVAFAVPFLKAEKHALVTNITTRDGKVLRVTKNQLKQIIHPTDLSQATVVDEAGLRPLREEAAAIRSMEKQYPRAVSVVAPIAEDIERTIQVIESGNVLLSGRLMSRSDYEKQMAASRGSSVDITLGGRSYKGAKLKSINAGKASITHSGGVMTIPITELSDDQIAKLNQTSNALKIDRSEPAAPLASTSKNSPMKDDPSPSVSQDSPPATTSAAHGSQMTERIRKLDEDEMARITRFALEQITLRIFDERQEMERFASANGWGGDEKKIEEIYEFNTRGLLEIEDYEKTMLAADYAIDNFGITLRGKSGVEAARIEWAESTTSDGREVAREKIRQIVQREAGVDLIALASNMSKQDLRAGIGGDTVVTRYEAFALSERSRMVSSFRRICNTVNVDETHADAIHFVFTSLDCGERSELYEAMETGRDIGTLMSDRLPAYLKGKAAPAAAILTQVGPRSMLMIESLVLSRGDLINISSHESPLRRAIEQQ